MEEQQFRRVVGAALRELAKQVDRIDSDDLDARLSDGVFQVDFEAGGTFVVSQQVPVSELWLSAFSRAWHFRWGEGRWTERDSHEPLELVLSELFSRKMGAPISILNPGPPA
jgi:iron donor protein CyaY